MKKSSLPSPANPAAADSPKTFTLPQRWYTGIFFGLILLMVPVLLYSGLKAGAVNEQYAQGMKMYNDAQQAFQAGQYDTAYEMLNKVIPQYKDSAPVQLLLGLTLLYRGDSAEAAAAFAAAQERNFWLTQNQQFVHSYGLALLNSSEYAAARPYLLKSIELNQSESRTEESRAALAKIEALSGGEAHGESRD